MKNVYIYFKWIHKVKAKGQHAIQRKNYNALDWDKVNSILIKKNVDMALWHLNKQQRCDKLFQFPFDFVNVYVPFTILRTRV